MAFTFTDENVNEIIESGKPVVIDFWATWCGPCKALAPVLDELAEQYEGQVVIGKYNVEEESDFSTDHRIMSLPTILFFKNGEKTSIRLTGSQSKETLEENELAEIFAKASTLHLEPKRLCLLRHKETGPVSLVLIQCRKGGKPGLSWEEWALFDAQGNPTERHKTLYHL